MHVRNKKMGISFMDKSCLTGKCATQKLKSHAVLVYGHVHIIWHIKKRE